jgi:uncharacterized protein YgiB involved in biofilm formation
MKRSVAVTLVLAGGATAAMIYGCKPKAETYANVQACVDAKRHTQQECEDAFTAASREHAAAAPHFQDRDQCIAAYGPNGCEERHEGGGSFFVPLMLGYVLGHGMGYHPLYQAPMGQGCRVAPDGRRYGNCPGGWFGHGGGWFGGYARTSSGSPGTASGSPGTASETSTVARGGFGSTGHGFGGGE